MSGLWVDKNGEVEVEVNGITSNGNIKLAETDDMALWVDTENGLTEIEMGGITTSGRIRVTDKSQKEVQSQSVANKVNTSNISAHFGIVRVGERYLLQGNPTPQRIDSIKNATLKDFDSSRFSGGFTNAELATLYRERAKRTRQSSRRSMVGFILRVCTLGMLAGGDGMVLGASIESGSSLDKKFGKITARSVLAGQNTTGFLQALKNCLSKRK